MFLLYLALFAFIIFKIFTQKKSPKKKNIITESDSDLPILELKKNSEANPYYIVINAHIGKGDTYRLGINSDSSLRDSEDAEAITAAKEVAWQLLSEDFELVRSRVIKPDSENIDMMNELVNDLKSTKVLVGHNVLFHANSTGKMLMDNGLNYKGVFKKKLCTMKKGHKYMMEPAANWPKLHVLYDFVSYGYKIPTRKKNMRTVEYNVNMTSVCLWQMTI